MTTHPALVVAVARWVKRSRSNPPLSLRAQAGYSIHTLKHVYDVTGMRRAAKETGAVLNYDVSFVRISCPEGRVMKVLDAIQIVAEADVIISLPKLKTHDLTQFTGAIKNMFGTVPV